MLRYFSLFSGIDKFASKAYSLIHKIPESKNYGDTGELNDFMEKRGFKVKRKSIGIPELQ